MQEPKFYPATEIVDIKPKNWGRAKRYLFKRNIFIQVATPEPVRYPYEVKITRQEAHELWKDVEKHGGEFWIRFDPYWYSSAIISIKPEDPSKRPSPFGNSPTPRGDFPADGQTVVPGYSVLRDVENPKKKGGQNE